MKRKIFKILGIALLIVFILGAALLSWTFYQIETGQLVKWEGKWYTKEELEEKYPPQEYEVEAKNTPEEVYEKFRQALLDDNKEEALEYIKKDEREEYSKIFKDEEKFNNYKTIPEFNKLEKSEKESFEGYQYYYYSRNVKEDGLPYSIIFIKNLDGYWKIESI